ncbi:MAG: cytidylate kinase-like family protein [Verrucomicrobiales bacterium]|nr:cytidylate kinase-like family protein [Verrucomicrobiales bacterium]MCP5525950.1 cytidylate kinase-like family protein [Verrucomicrobiales bacterium]
MKDATSADHCLSFISSQLRPASAKAGSGEAPKLAITLSRQTGAGAWLVAPRLAELLQEITRPAASRWTVFDRELVEKVLQDHNLPASLARFMPEDRIPYVQGALQELLGLHPPSWTLVEKTTETIRKLASLGNVILIGRGANVITGEMRHVFHARLVGSIENRTRCAADFFKLELKAAREFVERTDRGRQRYLKEHFGADVDDPLQYDLTINTDRVPFERAAELIASAALQKVGFQPPKRGH